jgi:hypothetical protein
VHFRIADNAILRGPCETDRNGYRVTAGDNTGLPDLRPSFSLMHSVVGVNHVAKTRSPRSRLNPEEGWESRAKAILRRCGRSEFRVTARRYSLTCTRQRGNVIKQRVVKRTAICTHESRREGFTRAICSRGWVYLPPDSISRGFRFRPRFEFRPASRRLQRRGYLFRACCIGPRDSLDIRRK